MKTYKIKSFSDLHERVEENVDRLTFYRGHRDINWVLKPKVGRFKFKPGESITDIERGMLLDFRDRAIPFLEQEPKDDWDWLSIAQHYGLPTRLLDWTKNILVAAFFAADEAHDGDSTIYAFYPDLHTRLHYGRGPFEIKDGIYPYNPRHNSRRVIAQQGCFTIYSNPEEEAPSDQLARYVIPNNYRERLKLLLNRYGINRSTLFPDLDGLTRYIEWGWLSDREQRD